MKTRVILSAVVAAASLLFANQSQSAIYMEPGDTGDLPGTAQVISGAPGTALTGISGELTLTNGLSDSDMYEITISNPSAFSASDKAFIPGANNFDSQLALFTSAGLGVVADDDRVRGGSQSKIHMGSVTLPAGNYYLLISGSGRYATSDGGLIFPNFTDGTTNPKATVGPTGPGGAEAITGYTGNSNEGGNYVIALTGAQFVASVPEPSTWATILAGAFGLILIMRLRRTAK